MPLGELATYLLAIGTSLAAIVFGSWSSFRTHHRHQAVDWMIVKTMTPRLLAGVAIGAVLARFVSTAFLKYFFLGFTLFVTAQIQGRGRTRRRTSGA